MPLLPRLSSLWHNLFHKDLMEQELTEEVQAYLELLVETKIKEGLKPEEARRAALIELGGAEQVKERVREVRMGHFLETIWQDLRYGMKVLARSPGFTTVAVLSLALGIGANTAIFSVTDALMLRRLPIRSPEQVVTFEQVFPDGRRQYNYSFPDFERFQNLTHLFSDMAATTWFDRYNVAVSSPGGGLNEGHVRVSLVTGNYFSMLGVNPLTGRTLNEDDDRLQGGHPVTVISYGYWERAFGRASDVVGRTLTLNGTTYTVIGVMPRGFSGDWIGWPTDLWLPVAMVNQVAPESSPGQLRGANFQYKIIARLKPGMAIEQAQADGQIFYQQLVNDPPQNTGLSKTARFEVVSAATGYSPQRESFAQPLVILMIVVGAVLLIACANVANLLLARAAARQREIAMRLALGAGRARVVRQLLTESVLLAMIGGVLGLLFSMWGTNFLAKLLNSSPVGSGTLLSIDLDLRPDGRILAFTSGLCLLTAILFGLAPALRGSKTSLVPALAGRGPDSAGSGSRFGLRKLLVISQVALSLVLLIGTGLFIRTLSNLKSEDLGFDREHLLLVWTQLGQTGRQPPEMASLWGAVQERTSSLPGVLSASPSTSGFLTGDIVIGPPLTVEGYTPKPDEDTRVLPKTIGPRFFETVGQQLLLGRDFTAQDVETSPPVVIINESLAHHFFGSDNPIGKRFRAGRSNSPLLEIVGVVTDAKYISPRENKDRMMFYYPYSQVIGRALMRMCLAVRAVGSSTSIAANVRQELQNIDPNLPVLKIDTIEEQLEDLLFQERLVTTIAGFFGALAVLLACIGLYGVISYSVARRTNEIGIRLALGAMPTDVLRMVLKESLLIVLAGIAIGIVTALATTRLISAMLFGISAIDLVTIAVATLLMIVVSALAAFIPARRASRIDPMIALRYE